MRYQEMLAAAVAKSGWTYTEIIRRCARNGQTLTKSYLCTLVKGTRPPASDGINNALAKVFEPFPVFTYEQLRVAAYKEGIPDDVLSTIIAEALESQSLVSI